MAISTQYGQSPDYFGHADYYKALESGYTPSQVLKFLKRNKNLIRGERNAPGGGGLYDEITNQVLDEQFKALVNQQKTLQETYSKQLEAYKTTSAEERKTLREGFASQLEAYKTTSAEERATLQEGFANQLKAYETASKEQQAALQSEFALQNRLKQEEARRQMLIGLQSKSKGPAPVRTAASTAQQQGLTTRGSTGYFGRKGLRIGSLNVPTSGMTISSGQQPTKVTNPGSFN